MRTNDFDRLTFLYTITGNTKNLKRMGALAAKRKDIHSRFHNALLVGDAAERVKILEETGQRAYPKFLFAFQPHPDLVSLGTMYHI
jgi:hypothetical protein